MTRDAAMEVMKYLVSDEFMLSMSKSGRMMAVQTDPIMKALGSESAFKNKNWKAAYVNKFAPLAPNAAYVNQVNAIYSKYTVSVMNGIMDMNTAFRTMEEESVKAIQTFKQTTAK
ncbi:MAG: hypothetical protein K0R28_4065 [Paenibacillus sp.]|jgi:multiple sugar transport system substrate-binding protein|nr:hypothetical protein [Paenibacillus sp.]